MPDTTWNTPTLETPRLRLRRFTLADAPALLALLGEEETNRFLPWFPLKTLEEAQAFIQQRFLESYQETRGARYALCQKGDDVPIGYICLSQGSSYDFGYCLGLQFWGRGYATEGGEAVLAHIRRAGYPYITATHDVQNPRSGRVMQRLGMAYQYTYVEQWQPKDIAVAFRLYQLNLSGPQPAYQEYWEKYPDHYIETEL